MVALAFRQRLEQAREQPVFWRKAADSADKHRARLPATP